MMHSGRLRAEDEYLRYMTAGMGIPRRKTTVRWQPRKRNDSDKCE